MTSDNTIIIVEGKSDSRRLKGIYPNINTFETSGLGLDDRKINQLIKMQKSGFDLICFTDPDGPGEKIRAKINEKISDVYNAYVSRANSRDEKRGKIGIESATIEEIEKALKDLKIISDINDIYDMNFLIENNLYGNKEKRELFCDKLSIANGNNKKLLKQLNNFQIPMEKVLNAIKNMESDEDTK